MYLHIIEVLHIFHLLRDRCGREGMVVGVTHCRFDSKIIRFAALTITSKYKSVRSQGVATCSSAN